MKCEECGEEVEGNVCKKCGLVIEDRPILSDNNGHPARKADITTLYAIEMRGWDHPLSPKIRKISRSFSPKYQKKYEDYIYVKAYESITKLCSQLEIPKHIKHEALNLFKGIRKIDNSFFKTNKLAPTYLACIKIACKINDFPISNYDLASVIDYEFNDDKKNYGYMEKSFNRSYIAILKLYNLNIKQPEHPKFIDYACEKLGLPYEFAVDIHKRYNGLKKYFEHHFKIEGYILALIYIFGRNKYNIYLDTLVDAFHISQPTIVSRRGEILNLYTVIIKFNDGRKDKQFRGVVSIDIIGKIVLRGCVSNEKYEFDWDDIKEVIIHANN